MNVPFRGEGVIIQRVKKANRPDSEKYTPRFEGGVYQRLLIERGVVIVEEPIDAVEHQHEAEVGQNR